MTLPPVPNTRIESNNIWLSWFNQIRLRINRLLSWFTDSSNTTTVTLVPFLNVPGIKSTSRVVTAPHATPTSVFTLAGEGIWIVGCYVRNALPSFPGYFAYGVFCHDGGGVRPIYTQDTLLTLSLTGLVIQATQTSGIAQPLTVTTLRIV